jgi:hypothetical protein
MFTNLTRPVHLAALSIAAAWLMAALFLAGCKGFWDPPVNTGTGTGTGSTATTTTLASSSSSVAAGAGVNLTATVAPAAATGTVTFSAGGGTIGTAALSSGTATFTATFSAAGTESLTATYGGDSTYAASTSGAVAVTVTPAAAASLVRPFGGANANPETNLVLAPEATWTSSATVNLHNVARVVAERSVASNIESSHCMLYSGTVFLTDGTETRSGVYDLQGGGYLAPEEKGPELGCQ